MWKSRPYVLTKIRAGRVYPKRSEHRPLPRQRKKSAISSPGRPSRPLMKRFAAFLFRHATSSHTLQNMSHLLLDAGRGWCLGDETSRQEGKAGDVTLEFRASASGRERVGSVWPDGEATGHGTQGARGQSGHRPTVAGGNDDVLEVDRGRTAHGNLDALESTPAQGKMMLYLGLTPHERPFPGFAGRASFLELE